MDFSDVKCKGKPFDGKTDFCQWKSQIECVLLVRGFYDVLQGIERKPESMTIFEYGELEAEACSIIRMSLTPTLRFQVWDETSAKALLEKLEKDYKANSVWHGCILRRKLHLLKMKEGFDVHHHIGEFQWLVNELIFLGEMHLDEEYKALLLLDSLSQSFEPLKSALPISRDKLTVDHVRERTIEMDLRMKLREFEILQNKPDQHSKLKGKPFDGKSKFCVWKIQIESALVARGCYEILRGIEQKPESLTLNQWERLEAEACSFIRLSLAPKLRSQVWKETSAKSLLEKLENDYKANSRSRGSVLRRELYALRMKEGSDVLVHIGKFQLLVHELTFLGEINLDEEDRALLLLNSLPHSFEALKAVLPIVRDKLTVDHVRERIIATDMKLKESNIRITCQTTKNKPGQHAEQVRYGDKSHVECFRCHRLGHYQNECAKYNSK